MTELSNASRARAGSELDPPPWRGSGERILVVDDEPDIAALVAYHLAKVGYRVSTAATGPDALHAVREERPALVVLDRMLPGMTGDEVLAELRADPGAHNVAVIMLSARREEPDRIHGLTLGADDYITKPFSPQELVLRAAAVLRRTHAAAASADTIVAGALQIDILRHRVTFRASELDLTPTEFKLLLTLAQRRGRVQSRGQLLEEVWDASHDVQTRTVDMHVQRLRTKLESAGGAELIETIRGFGYRLRAGSAS